MVQSAAILTNKYLLVFKIKGEVLTLWAALGSGTGHCEFKVFWNEDSATMQKSSLLFLLDSNIVMFYYFRSLRKSGQLWYDAYYE